MISIGEQEEIKKIIKSGFDLELISFELDIPLEEIKELKKELDKENKAVKTRSAKEIIDERNNAAHKKMVQLRERYKRLYFRNNESKTINKKELSSREIKEIELIIDKIEQNVQSIQQANKEEKRKTAKVIIDNVIKIESYQLTIEQAEKIGKLLNDDNVQKTILGAYDRIELGIGIIKKIIATKLAQAVEIAFYQTEDVEELKRLDKKITSEILERNPTLIGGIKTRILYKISEIQRREIINKIKNDISTDILKIVEKLVQGTLDVEDAKIVIEQEAKKQYESKKTIKNKTKARFLVTEEQQKSQILMKIRSAIVDRAEEYPIENPQVTVEQLYELDSSDIGQTIRVVVQNLVNTKRFEEAKVVCREFSKYKDDEKMIKNMMLLKKEIRNAEIGDLVLRGIYMEGTIEEERTYFELIEKGLNSRNVKIGAISLGKSKDGLKDISLADIWSEDKNKSKYEQIR